MKDDIAGALTETEIQLIQEHLDFTEGNENPLAVWVIGRPAAGKTTVASLLRDVLRWRGHRAELVDGDHIRSILGGFYGFSPVDRMKVFRKYVDLNQTLQGRGIIPVTATVAESAGCREIVRRNLGNAQLVYLNCSVEVAARRDRKGLYARIAAGELGHFGDMALMFSAPIECQMEFDSAKLDPLEIVTGIMKHLNFCEFLRMAGGETQWSAYS